MTSIEHVVWIHDSARRGGGAEQYIWQTARLLRARGVRSTLLYDIQSTVGADMLEAFDGVFPIVDLAAQLAALRPDVIYAHNPPGERWPEALLGVASRVVRFFHDYQLFCLRQHKYTTLGRVTCTQPVGLGCYACLGFVNRAPGWPGVRLRTVSALQHEQRRNQRFARFVVASAAMAEEVAKHGFSQAKIHVLPLFSELPAPEPVERSENELLYVGALTRGKGLDILLEAMARGLPSARLIVAGRGPQEVEFRQRALDLGLGRRVDFVGSLPAEELNCLYRRAVCLVLPARAPETFGLVGLEAMSRGTPVVASDVGGICEWLSHGQTGYAVPAGDPDALAAAVQNLLDHPALARAMGEAGLARHREQFLPERHLDGLLDVFASVARCAA